jgi:hypothetical protein
MKNRNTSIQGLIDAGIVERVTLIEETPDPMDESYKEWWTHHGGTHNQSHMAFDENEGYAG